jgi:hypothetical protein
MSATNLTEEASKVRSNAASSVIQTEFVFRDLRRDFDSFKTEFNDPLAKHSSSIEQLANNEYTQVLEIKNRSENLLEKVKSDAILCSSAVSSSSSLSPPSSSAVLLIMSDIENVSVSLINANSTLSQFSISGDFVEQWQILKTTLDNIDNALVGSKNAIDKILKLLFG